MRVKTQEQYIAAEITTVIVSNLACNFCEKKATHTDSNMSLFPATHRFLNMGWCWIDWPKYDSQGIACPDCREERDNEVEVDTP